MIKGQYVVNHYRKEQWLGQHLIDNAIGYDGLNTVINAFIFGTYVSQNWFIGLIDANNSLNNGRIDDTMSNHPSWEELQVYDAIDNTITVGTDTLPISGRPRWPYSLPITTPAISGSNTIINISSEGVINGLFICSDYKIYGSDGVLFSTGLGRNNIYVYPEDKLTVSYTLRCRTSPSFVSDQRLI